MSKRSLLFLAALALMFGGVGRAKADYIANVTLDTTALTNNPSQGPFSVVFNLGGLVPGSGNNNTATISNFDLHGGSLTSGTIISSGLVSGNLTSTLTLTSNPVSLFFQEFTPGSSTPSSLSFTLDLTTTVGQPPDALTFILGTAPNFSNTSVFEITITGPNPMVGTFGGSLANGVSVPAPVVTPEVSSVPEPSTLTLLGIGSLGLLGYGWRRRKQAAPDPTCQPTSPGHLPPGGLLCWRTALASAPRYRDVTLGP